MNKNPKSGSGLEDAFRDLASSGCRVVLRGDDGYDEAREISNSRFDVEPLAVAFPRSTDHVVGCVRFCEKNQVDLRVRSGGHQHEGMCSGNGVLMIRLSEMSILPPIDDKTEEAWIPTGARLEDVYEVLKFSNKIIPGGGCKSVNVGGLTLGGGWGLSARKYGLACDNVRAVEVVLSSGHVVVARPDNEHADLFWALLGSGGGNFGIATHFLYSLREIEPMLSKYKVYWTADHRTQVLKRWLEFQSREQSRETTSYLVLFAKLKGDECYTMPAVYAGGMHYGDESSLRAEVEGWIDDLESKGIEPVWELKIEEFPRLLRLDAGRGSNDEEPSLADFVSYADFPELAGMGGFSEGGQSHDCRAPFPLENCKGAHPHKVSSAFPIDCPRCSSCKPEEPCVACRDYDERLARTISEFIESNPVDTNVKSYISLYSMGGAIADRQPEESAFWFRNKKFVIQIESWWNYPKCREPDCRDDPSWQEPYIDWVRSFRGALRDKGLIEGAFINFVDRDLDLADYYGENFQRLKRLKADSDPEEFFRFEMSIPPERASET